MEFRLSVCLTNFFSDERSYCYIYLDQSYEKISALEHYLRHLFHLKGDFCLMVNNYLLPSEQPTRIISFGDTVTLVPLQTDWNLEPDVVEVDAVEAERNTEEDNAVLEVIDVVGEEKITKKKKKKKSKPETIEPSIPAEEEIIPENNKVEPEPIEPESAEKDSEKQPKKDSEMDVSVGSDADREVDVGTEAESALVVVADQEDNESDMEEYRVTDIQSAIHQLRMKTLSLLNETAIQRPAPGVSSGRINKRKRCRKRNKNTSLSMSTPDLTDSPATVPLAFKPMNQSASHIRFENDQPMMQNTMTYSERSMRPRIIHAMENHSLSNSRRASVCGSPPVDIVSTSTINPQITPSENGNSKPETNEKKSVPTVNVMRRRLSEFPVMDNVYPVPKDMILFKCTISVALLTPIKRDYSVMVCMYVVPKDMILFKTLKIGTNYLPVVSDFILANVIEVDKDKDLVKLSVLDGHSECVPPTGKFDLEPAQALKPGEDLVLDITWAHVVKPRLVFP